LLRVICAWFDQAQITFFQLEFSRRLERFL